MGSRNSSDYFMPPQSHACHGCAAVAVFQIIPGHNFLLSSGGELLDSSGVALSYFNYELVFIVKTNTSTWMGLYNITLQPGFW